MTSPNPPGITDEMVERALEVFYSSDEEGWELDVSWSDEERQRMRRAMQAALNNRTTSP